jgi:hypothetical protein
MNNNNNNNSDDYDSDDYDDYKRKINDDSDDSDGDHSVGDNKNDKSNIPQYKNDINFEFPSNFLLCAQSKGGKTHLVRHLITKFYREGVFEFGLVFSPSSFNNNYYYLPQSCLYSNYDESVLRDYLEGIKKNNKIERN